MDKKIKIAVNARFLISGKLEGIGTYSHQVLQRLVKEMPEVEFHFLFDRPFSKEFIYAENVIPHQIGLPARHPFLWFLWFEFAVSKWLFKNKMDLFIGLDSFLSLSADVKSILVMHDLAFEHFPKHNPFLVRHFYKYFFPKYAHKATKILAVSNFTKNDIIDKYKIEASKIDIAYCGVSEVYKPISLEEKSAIQKEITNALPYFICIGSLNPRKNISKAIKAFNLLKSEKPTNIKLVIVGSKGWKTSDLFNEIENSPFKADIIRTGHLSPEMLSKYLAGAEALVFPSLFEGFGIPVIEAYQCQVPVITSNCSSTKEIGENVAILINPESELEIKNAMLSILDTHFNINEYIKAATLRVKSYNWEKTSLIFKETINQILGRKVD